MTTASGGQAPGCRQAAAGSILQLLSVAGMLAESTTWWRPAMAGPGFTALDRHDGRREHAAENNSSTTDYVKSGEYINLREYALWRRRR
jgi:hypothetical protein